MSATTINSDYLTSIAYSLQEIVAMECTDDKGNLDSFGKFPFAQAIRLLAKRDDVSIIVERGPIIKAQWK